MSLFSRKKNIIETGILKGMTDTHSHLLFGVDDGARTPEHSADIIQQLKEYGVRRSFATPHIMANVTNDFQLTTIQAQNLGQQHDFEIRLVAEYMLDEQFLEKLFDETKLLTYDGTRLLVELSHIAPPRNVDEILFEIENSGYIPVIAHPERYCAFFGAKDYDKLKERGCQFQLNLLSLTEAYGRKVNNAAYELLKNGLYDFIGSDAHNIRGVRMIQTITLTTKQSESVGLLVKNNDLLWV